MDSHIDLNVDSNKPHMPPPRLFVRTASDDTDLPLLRPGSVSSLHTTSSGKTMEENQEALWQELNEFYAQNQLAIERAAVMDVSIENMSDMDVAVETFVETANTLLPGLVALANIHPGLGVVVFAFAGVISLETARRGNNRKVLGVNLQMQNMMCALFQLRKLRHVHIEEPEREEEQSRLHRLIKSIAHEIKVCGSDMDYYMDRKFVSKLINSRTYEHRFAFHIETFARRRSELQSSITAYIATGIDAANLGIMDIQDKLFNMDDKINSILHAFRTMDTPREREIRDFIESNGGPELCISKDDLLIKLLLKSGDNVVSAKQAIVKGQDLVEIRQSLAAELNERLDTVMAANLPHFERLLNVQNNNFERILDKIENQGYEISDHTTKLDKLVTTTISILEEERHIRKATAPVMSISFTDPVLQFIWNRMGLKGSVKAKTFVLTFRDIFQVESAELSREFSTPIAPGRHTIYTPFLETSPTRALSLLHTETQDHWALKYIDVSHVQPVVEAMDEDGSGFISVNEANTFAISRPKGWSFLRWVAYWAAGWHVDVTNYRARLYTVAQQIHHAVRHVHSPNRAYADEYMSNKSFSALEALLRSVTPMPANARIDSRLAQIVESMSSLMETRLMKNLEEMHFVLESPATVNLVVGSGRVEVWILPLLCLILDRHLRIIKLGQSCVLHEKELVSHAKTLESIFSLVNDRINHLESIFRTHVNQEVKAQFDKFAFGMFSALYAGQEGTLSGNTLLTFKDDKASLSRVASSPDNETRRSSSIFAKGPGPAFVFDEIDISPRRSATHPMEGQWTGQCIRTNNNQIAFQGFFHFSIDHIINGKISGRGETYLGEVVFSGVVEPVLEADAGLLDVELRITSEQFADLWCLGQYDPVRESIAGQWVVDDGSGDFPSPDDDTEERQMDLRLPCGHFSITRTPPSVFRFRRILDDYEACTFRNPAARWWAFAIEAVRFQIRERLLSWDFIQKHTAERRKWMSLTIRRELDKASPTSKPQLSEEGQDALFALRLTAHPTVGRMYDALSSYFYKRMAFSVGPYNCHSCDRRIIFFRYQCVICTSDDFSSQLDLCGDCINVAFPLPGSTFEHHISHTLVRSSHRIFDCEIASIIMQARSASERIKSLFRSMESAQGGGAATPGSDARSRLATPTVLPNCARCGDAISLPCYVCVICSLTYCCLSCDANRLPLKPQHGISNTHILDHPLLRINDSREVVPAELKASRLEKQLQDMEVKLSSTILSLSQKIDSQLGVHGSHTHELAAHSMHPGVLISPPLADRNAELVPAASMVEAKLARSRTTAGFAAKRKRNEEGALAARLEERMLALETKVDRQFGQLLLLMQQLVAGETPFSTTK